MRRWVGHKVYRLAIWLLRPEFKRQQDAVRAFVGEKYGAFVGEDRAQ
jgi:hypothetical protein